MDPTENRQIERAVSRHHRALARGTAPCRADGDAQADNFRAALERAELRAAQMKAVLHAAQVLMGQTLLWRNFILHLDRLARTCGGVTASVLVRAGPSRAGTHLWRRHPAVARKGGGTALGGLGSGRRTAPSPCRRSIRPGRIDRKGWENRMPQWG